MTMPAEPRSRTARLAWAGAGVLLLAVAVALFIAMQVSGQSAAGLAAVLPWIIRAAALGVGYGGLLCLARALQG